MADQAAAAILPPDVPARRRASRSSGPPIHRSPLSGPSSSSSIPPIPAAGIHATAVVAPSAGVGAGVSIGPFCVVGEGAEIGAGTVLYPLVTVYPRRQDRPGMRPALGRFHLRQGVWIGDRVILHNGVVIGADGFGYVPDDDRLARQDPAARHRRHRGRRRDRGQLDHRPGRPGGDHRPRGAKIDNLVIVAHNVEIGENAILVAQSGVAGSAKVGRGAILSGQVGVPDHVEIGEGAIVAAKTGVTGNVRPAALSAAAPTSISGSGGSSGLRRRGSMTW